MSKKDTEITRQWTRAAITALFFLVLILGDIIFSQERQFAGTENGREVVVCSVVGKWSAFHYNEYVCARGNDVWQPIPVE